MKEHIFECCICHRFFTGFGNNPDGAMWKTESGEIVDPEFKADDRCCNDCDGRYVIPGRMYRLQQSRARANGTI